MSLGYVIQEHSIYTRIPLNFNLIFLDQSLSNLMLSIFLQTYRIII